MNFKDFYHGLNEGLLSGYDLDEIKNISETDWENNEGDTIVNKLKNDLGDVSYYQFKELIRKEGLEQDIANNTEDINLNDPMKYNDDDDMSKGGGGEIVHDIS